MVLWPIESDPLPWAILLPIASCFMGLPFPMVLCFMEEVDDVVECPMLPLDMLDEVLWAKAGAAKAAASRAAAAKV